MSDISNRARYHWQVLTDFLRHSRRAMKGAIPFVRRRQLERLSHKYEMMVELVHGGVPLATDTPIEIRKPADPAMAGEVCIFVTHAPRTELKTHVRHHLEHLLRAGLQVVLVVNADVPLEAMVVEPALQERLTGVYVRRNEGFDFAAWCHAIALCDRARWERLYLVNDSIVGPLDAATFDAMMARIRGSGTDLTGLTENPLPIAHLQSFFLVLGKRVLQDAGFERFVRRMANLPDKAPVVDVYEVRLTRTLRAAGFTASAIFTDPPQSVRVRGDTYAQWERLVAMGFPYVKTRVLQEKRQHPKMADVRAKAHVDDQV